ncbi:hypothetical protein J3R82DRAFT_10790 [Butyriboletus roseoflavus]|nr:hypothetical protein J3R82DRAFT_10790 [Butyriboletus roseoflavus]
MALPFCRNRADPFDRDSMSVPRLIGQILFTGAQILGKALAAAGKQAVQNAKHRPEALSADVGGVRNATSGSATDKLTREHRMTLDEAHLILNVKRGEAMENIMKASGCPVIRKRDGVADRVLP